MRDKIKELFDDPETVFNLQKTNKITYDDIEITMLKPIKDLDSVLLLKNVLLLLFSDGKFTLDINKEFKITDYMLMRKVSTEVITESHDARKKRKYRIPNSFKKNAINMTCEELMIKYDKSKITIDRWLLEIGVGK